MVQAIADRVRRALQAWGLGYADPQSEARFVEFYCHRHLPKTRMFLLLGAALVYVFFNWDRIIDPVGWEFGHAVRGFVLAPLAVLVAVLVSIPRMQRHEEWLTSALMVGAYTGLTVIYTRLADGFLHGAVGIVLVMMFSALLLRMRFPFLAASALLGAAVFMLSQAAFYERHEMLLVNGLVVVSSLLFGLLPASRASARTGSCSTCCTRSSCRNSASRTSCTRCCRRTSLPASSRARPPSPTPMPR